MNQSENVGTAARDVAAAAESGSFEGCPNDGKVLAVLALLCAGPIGVAAYVHAAKVGDYWIMGFHDLAKYHARVGKAWATFGIVVAIICLALWLTVS